MGYGESALVTVLTWAHLCKDAPHLSGVFGGTLPPKLWLLKPELTSASLQSLLYTDTHTLYACNRGQEDGSQWREKGTAGDRVHSQSEGNKGAALSAGLTFHNEAVLHLA